jgi:hypothetical protein
MASIAPKPPSLPLTASRLARWALTAFVLTFLLARIAVLLIMTRRIPDLFLHVGQTHVHHMNYGIFLLAALGAWLLFAPPIGAWSHPRCARLRRGPGIDLRRVRHVAAPGGEATGSGRATTPSSRWQRCSACSRLRRR